MTEEFLSWLAAVIAERGTLFKGIKILLSEEYKALVKSEQADPDMLYLVWDEGETLSGVKILVNGEVVDEFNADTKVDRVDEPNQLYGTDENGNPTTYPTDSVGTQVKVDGQKVKEFNADEKFDKTGGVISGNVAIQGDLSVTGTTTTKNTETLNVKDNVIVANADGAEVIEDSGFAIKTSTTTAYGIMYDPVGDGVKIGLGSFDENGKFIYDEGEAQFLATRADNITDGNLPQWDNEKKQFVDSGEKIGDFVKKTDFASGENAGISCVDMSFEKVYGGIFMSTLGTKRLIIRKASYGDIDRRKPRNYFDGGLNGTDNCAPIVPSNLDYATMSALADCKDPTLWTDDSTDENGEVVKGTKTKALELLGAVQKKNDIFPTDGGYYVYAIDRNGNNILLGANYYAGAGLAVRSNLGHILVPNMTETDHEGFAVNKKYVKDGFVPKQNPEFDSGATRGYVYFIDVNGNQTVVKAQIQAIANGTIPIRDSWYNFYVGNPKQPQHCTPKNYVDNLPKYLALTEDSADENGEVVRGTKTEWQDWLGVNSLIAEVSEEVKTVESIAKGANQAISFADYQTMIAALNALPKGKYNIGQCIYIGTLNVPDIWVSGILDNSVAYTYTTDEDIAEKLKTNNAVQAGHYILSPLETQKVDLTDYVKNTDRPTSTTAGPIKIDQYYGFQLGQYGSDGVLMPMWASNALIDSKNEHRFINPKNFGYAFKVAATTNTEEWTEEEKAKARALFGVKDDLITYGTEDIGVDAPLEDGKLYLVFEE